MGRSVVADGISIVENKAFQSFIARVYGKTKKSINIPQNIHKHLLLQTGDVLEVAIRKVTREYAEKNYGITFWSFQTICPKCGKIGIVYRLKNAYCILHREKGRRRTSALHYISKKLFETLKPTEGSF